MEDQLGARRSRSQRGRTVEHLLDAAVKHLRVHGEIEITIDITAHLSPLSSAHTHSVGRYTFSPTHHVSASAPCETPSAPTNPTMQI